MVLTPSAREGGEVLLGGLGAAVVVLVDATEVVDPNGGRRGD